MECKQQVRQRLRIAQRLDLRGAELGDQAGRRKAVGEAASHPVDIGVKEARNGIDTGDPGFGPFDRPRPC